MHVSGERYEKNKKIEDNNDSKIARISEENLKFQGVPVHSSQFDSFAHRREL